MEMKIERKVRKIGDSLTFSIPAEIVKQLGVREGEIWESDRDGDKIIYTKKREENK